jgi:hypothetical protein
MLDTEALEVETELGFNEGFANDVVAVWGVAQRDEARPVLLFAKAGVGIRPITETPPTIRGSVSGEDEVAAAIDDADSAEIPAAAVELGMGGVFSSPFPDRIALGPNLGAEGTLPARAVRPMALMKSSALAKEQVNTVGFDEGAVLPLDWPVDRGVPFNIAIVFSTRACALIPCLASLKYVPGVLL